MHQIYRLTEERPPRAVWSIRRVTLNPSRPLRARRAVFEPPTDVYETPDSVVVRMEIAGLRPEELEVTLVREAQVLVISGRRLDPGAGSPRKYYTMEIECGEFARQLRLPQTVDENAVSATYADGFLEVKLPKAPPAPPRKVAIE